MTAIAAERQAGVERLLGADRRARVRKIGDGIRSGVQHRKRLFIMRLEGPVTCVYRYHVAAIGRDSHRERQSVDLLRIPRNFAEELFARGEIYDLRRSRLRSGDEDSAQDHPYLSVHA